MFNYFKRKKEAENKRIEELNKRYEIQVELQNEMFSKYPLGSTVDYMGVGMKVTSHFRFRPEFRVNGIVRIWAEPAEVYFDYVNKNGEIVEIKFTCSEMDNWNNADKDKNIKANQFKCECCLGIFEEGWTEEEAQKERIKNGFGDIPDEDLARVCEDCYQMLMAANGRGWI